jgi:2-oxoacid:acceptor oxidoreductase gamma subunit (pyruvate/2-ketoisovalerate family)
VTFEIRIHSRGGQGVVTAAELLAAAAFAEGRHAQAFPSFGSERTGAPVVSFCRVSDRPIRTREPVMHPDALIIQDPTLLHQMNVFEGIASGALGITSFRPFPLEQVRAALGGAERVVVLEKALAVGIGGIVSANVRMALSGIALHGYTAIAGLGGRAITKASLRDLFARAAANSLDPLTFFDLDRGLVDQELQRMAERRRSGPSAENMLRDLGAVGSRIG